MNQAQWDHRQQQLADAPDVRLLSERKVKARKEYVCAHCRQPILTGQTCYVVTGTEDGTFFTSRSMHSPYGECIDRT